MFQFAPIGIIHSCFGEKFGIPRQPGLVPAAHATLELLPPYAQPAAVRGLEGFSHVWVIFEFHGIAAGHWHPTVRPPRLGGNQRLGVFATRTPFRPNPIGLSAVRLDRIVAMRGRVTLHLTGVDLLDGTPVLDLKPYVPYADHIAEASGGFAAQSPTPPLTVRFSRQAQAFCAAWPDSDLPVLIHQVLGQDPRPAYAATQSTAVTRTHGVKLGGLEVRWKVRGTLAYVTEIRHDPATNRATALRRC